MGCLGEGKHPAIVFQIALPISSHLWARVFLRWMHLSLVAPKWACWWRRSHLLPSVLPVVCLQLEASPGSGMWQQFLLGAVGQVLQPEGGSLLSASQTPGLPTHPCPAREMYPHVSRKPRARPAPRGDTLACERWLSQQSRECRLKDDGLTLT